MTAALQLNTRVDLLALGLMWGWGGSTLRVGLWRCYGDVLKGGYLLGFHSLARRWASAICWGVILVAIMSRFFNASLFP